MDASLTNLWLETLAFVFDPLSMAVCGAAVGSLASGLGVHWWQRRTAEVLPTLPSHAEALRRPPDEATRFFSSVHELTMTITEAWNAARARGGVSLEEVVKRERLAQIVRELELSGGQLRQRLGGYERLADALPIPLMASVWTYEFDHNYRTETYTTTETDSQGKSRTVTKTRQVYDSTDHTFTFDARAARRAEQALRQWLGAFRGADLPMLHLHGRFVDVGLIDPVERSFLERLVRHTVLEDPEATVDEADLSHWVNQWLVGTRIDAKLTAFGEAGEVVAGAVDRSFVTIHASAPRFHERTGSRTHPGPAGYQAHASLKEQLFTMQGAWQAAWNMMGVPVSHGRKLLAWAQDPGEIEPDTDYVELAATAYETAFPGSELTVDQLPTWGPKLLGAFLGAVGGGTLTGLLHPAGPLWS